MRLVALAVAAVALLATEARAGDPLRVYETIETDHFVVVYYKGLEDVARRAAIVGERAHRTLAPAFDHQPIEKTIMIVVDDTDGANGFANTLPRNSITIFATAPDAFSELDDHEDWLYGLIAHEYTHILHLDTIEGLPTIYNRIFGKTWSPNQIMPRWVIEGLATYEETKRSAGGRNRGTRFDQYIRIARHEQKVLRLDEVSGAPRQFPRGNSAYVYGSHFLRYIFDRFGDDTVRGMSHAGGKYPIPFSVNRHIAKVIGEPFTELYGDWMGYVRDRYSQQEQAAERRGTRVGKRLTTTGEANYFAQYQENGNLTWLQSDGIRPTYVRTFPAGSSEPEDIMQIEALGGFDLESDGSMVYEQGGWLHRREYQYQDIFRWDARTKQVTRLTRGRRARDPSVSADGRRVAYSQNGVSDPSVSPEARRAAAFQTGASESVLAVMANEPDAPPSIVWKGQRFDQAYQPAWSPDGTRIAFSAWRRGGFRDILVVELASGLVTEITADRAIDQSPQWSPDGRYLVFDSDRTGIANIYAYDMQDQSTWQVTNVLGGAFRASVSPDGKRIAFDAAVAKGGYDLYELELDRRTWMPARAYVDDRPTALLIRNDDSEVPAPRPYRPVETLAPQVYTLTTLFGEDPSVTLQTSGSDAAGIHSYQLSVGMKLDNGDLNIGAAYGYGLFRMPLRIAMARSISDRLGYRIDGVNLPYRQEDWSFTVSSNVPFEGRPDQSWSLSFDYDFDYARLVEEPDLQQDPNTVTPGIPVADYVQGGISTRIGYSRARGVTFGLGPTRGWDAAVSLRFDHEYLGAKFQQATVSYAANAYQRLWGNTPTLSARLTGAFRGGDLFRGGSFSLGGIPTQDLARAIIQSTRVGSTGYLRGYEPRVIAGNQFHLLNLEYRQELWRIERGLETLPVYLRRVHLGLLSDTGVAWDGDFDAGRHLKTSVGAALRLDAFFGYFIGGTFELGAARGLNDGGITNMWLLLTGSL